MPNDHMTGQPTSYRVMKFENGSVLSAASGQSCIEMFRLSEWSVAGRQLDDVESYAAGVCSEFQDVLPWQLIRWENHS